MPLRAAVRLYTCTMWLKTGCSILLVSLCVLAAPQSIGGGKNPNLNEPEWLGRANKASNLTTQGRELARKGQLEEAMALFRQAIEINKTVPAFRSAAHYELAKALALVDRVDEALEQYKQAFRWAPGAKRLGTNGPPFPYVHLDYAILLARAGRAEDAKAVYYDALRDYNYPPSHYKEPVPFLVLFDPEPGMTYWEYSPEKLILAARTVRAMDTSRKEDILEIRRLEPSWYLPALMLVLMSSGAERSGLHVLAENLATNDEERGWVLEYRALEGLDQVEETRLRKEIGDRLAAVGRERRVKSVVLAEARRQLEQNWSRLAASSAP